MVCVLSSAGPASGKLRYEVAWKAQGKVGFCGPNELRDAATGKALGIVVCEVGQGIVCFTPDGKRRWTYALKPPVTACPAVGDIDGDGAEDVVACGGQGAVVALDANGKLKWTARTPGAVRADSCPAIADLDGDGAPEILVGDISGCLSCFSSTGTLRWWFRGDGQQMGPTLVADLYDTPGREIVVTSQDGHIYALTAKGDLLWDLYRRDDLFPNTTPILADVDGDGVGELYIGGGLHHFYRIDLAKHRIALEQNVYLHVNAAICGTDLDGDGKDEVVYGNKGGAIRCYGAGGERWKRELPNCGLGSGSSPIAINLDDDADLEIMFCCRRLHVLDADGALLLDTPPPTTTGSPSLAGDFDGDGRLETIVAAHGTHVGNTLACLKWNVPYRRDARAWTVFAGNRAHTGRPPGAKAYRPLPAPVRQDAPAKVGGPGFAPYGDVSFVTGPNRWRFDVTNPQKRRLVLLTDVVHPDGSMRRFANHVLGETRRVVLDVHVRDEGTYRVQQKLMDADRLAVLTSRKMQQSFTGLAGDQAYLDDVFRQTADALEAWCATNRPVADGMGSELLAFRGQLRSLAAGEGKDDPSLLPSLVASAARLRALARAGRVLAPTGSFCAWQTCPWGYFGPRESVPTPQDRTKRLSAALCVGEYESLALNLTNLGPRTLAVRVSPGDLVGTKTFPAYRHLAFRRAVTVPTVRNERVADALPLLDQARLLSIAPRESEQLWITVNATGLAPGEYVADLRLKSVEPDPTEVKMPIHVKVHDLALPRPRPLRFCVWAMATSVPDYELKDLVDHGVTVHFGTCPSATCNAKGEIVGELDFAKHDATVQRLARHGVMLFMGPQGGVRGQPMFSEPWRKAFVTYMRRWATHMKAIGMGYEGWALYPYDEPSTPYAETTRNLVEVAKLVRQADPNIRIYTDPTSGTTMTSVKMLTGLIDIWCPSSELLERLGDELIPVAKRVGKEVWFYDAAGGSRTLSCLGLYRWRFWYAWNLGLTGAGWWVYASGDYFWDGLNPTGDYFSTVYRAPGAVVTSKRWEVAREGIEDYEILYLLKDAVARAKKKGIRHAAVADAEKLLAELPVSVATTLVGTGRRLDLTPDSAPVYKRATAAVQEARRKIVAACIRLNEQMK